MNEQEKTPSFEERLLEVQKLTGKIESGALPLEDSVKEYERGMKILAELSSELENMNRRVTVLQNGKETEVSDESV
ncbi:MAG: exodeoxyribonuclease VII small subunit [Clostridia bacterium]|jgi:exodeoxyribonuclease VII small subunit|nr:exodeoxyribonuclease VII small subunit [Clostridia bacterium]